ncbi:MAG: EthD domain-containing protein, partial [Novosphingobium sp.]
MATLVVCIKRNPALTYAEFDEYWRENHGPLVRGCSAFTRHLKRYVQFHVQAADSPVGRMFGVSGDFDGVAMLEF